MIDYLPRILITGGHGQIASALIQHPLAAQCIMSAPSRDELDITQPAAIDQAITKFVPDIIVNTAAYTSVDKAEHEASLADRVNHIGAGLIALACDKNQIKLLHLSTDYIFDGGKDGKYMEDDPANPINIYGKTKWDGEQAIRQSCNNHLILRVSGVFSEYGDNFLKTMLKLARERSSLRVVSDQVTCPTYAGDIAGVILQMCLRPKPQGTFHYCSSEAVSWFDFASVIIDTASQHEKLAVSDMIATTAAEYPTSAKRPRFSVLDCHKIEKSYDIMQPSWRAAVELVIPRLIREKA